MSNLISDVIYCILSKNEYSLEQLLKLRLVSLRFRSAITNYHMLDSMTTPAQFIVFLDNQELLGEVGADGRVLVEAKTLPTSFYMITDKKNKTWIVIECAAQGYIVIKIKTEKNNADWSYAMKAVSHEPNNILSSVIEKFDSSRKLVAITSVEYPETGFQVGLQGNNTKHTIKVISKIIQPPFFQFGENLDNVKIVDKNFV